MTYIKTEQDRAINSKKTEIEHLEIENEGSNILIEHYMKSFRDIEMFCGGRNATYAQQRLWNMNTEMHTRRRKIKKLKQEVKKLENGKNNGR